MNQTSKNVTKTSTCILISHTVLQWNNMVTTEITHTTHIGYDFSR